MPKGASRRAPVPALLTSNGFGGGAIDPAQAALAHTFVDRGYAVLSYSGLGFPGSGCKITVDHPAYDGKAASQLVGNQLALAATDPRLDAITPMVTWNDMQYALAPNNGNPGKGVSTDLAGPAKLYWAAAFLTLGAAEGLLSPQDPVRFKDCPNFTREACGMVVSTLTRRYPDKVALDFGRQVSFAHYGTRVKTPTLLIQGEHDGLFNVNESLATYRMLKANGAPVKLAWYVRKDRTADTGPEFAYYRDWVRFNPGGSAAPAYGTVPAVGSGTKYYLSGTGDLVSSRARVKAGAATYVNEPNQRPTSYAAVPGLEFVLPPWVNQPYDKLGTFAAYSTEKFAKPTTVVGTPTLDLRLRSPEAARHQGSNADKLILFAKVYDVAPNGRQTLVHNAVSPVRVADVNAPLRVTLPGQAHRYEPGHRLRVVIAASDFAYQNNHRAYPVSLPTSRTSPGVLTLPTS